MTILNIENAAARLACGFWDDVNEIILEEFEYSNEKCEFDECPFLALKEGVFCKEHQKEWENIEAGRQPDEDN